MRPWGVTVDPPFTSASSRCTAAKSLSCAAWMTGAAFVMLPGCEMLSVLHITIHRYILHCVHTTESKILYSSATASMDPSSGC
jgi:hypothetical protein